MGEVGGGRLIQPPLQICPIELHSSIFWVQKGPMDSQGYIGGILNYSRFIYWPLEACQIDHIRHQSYRVVDIVKNQLFGSGA